MHGQPLATQPVKAGEEVGLIMKEGVMYTVATDNTSCRSKRHSHDKC